MNDDFGAVAREAQGSERGSRSARGGLKRGQGSLQAPHGHAILRDAADGFERDEVGETVEARSPSRARRNQMQPRPVAELGAADAEHALHLTLCELLDHIASPCRRY